MASGGDVLSMLCPNEEWTIYDNDYNSIIWHKGIVLVTEEEFNEGFAKYDAWKAQKEAEDQAKRAAALAKLEALGLDEDDLKSLGLN